MWGSVRDASPSSSGGTRVRSSLRGHQCDHGQTGVVDRQLLLTNLLTDVVPAIAIAISPPRGRSAEQLLARTDRSLAGPCTWQLPSGHGHRGRCWSSVGGGRLTGRARRANTVGLVALVGRN